MKTGSEFCCEEHAEQYKKETVGRLLEYAEPLHPPSGRIDPMHRLAILAGEKPSSEEEPSWQIQGFVALMLRHQAAPRIPVSPANPTPPRPHRPRGGEIQPRKIWNPSLVHLLPKEGPWSRWFPAEPALCIPTGMSLSGPARHRQPAATRAEAKSGLLRRSAQGLPAAALAMGAGAEPSRAAPPSRRTAPASVAMGLPRTRTTGPGHVHYPPPTSAVRGFPRIAPALGFLPVSAGLAAAPAASGGLAMASVVPVAWHPVPAGLQALPFAPLRRGTPSFLSLAAAPRVGPNGCSHRSPEVTLRSGFQPALRLPELPPARKLGRLSPRPPAASQVLGTRLLDAVTVLPAASDLARGAVHASSPALLCAPAPLEPPVAVLGVLPSPHTVAPASIPAPPLAPAVERLASAVPLPALNTWNPTAGLTLLRPASSPLSSAPAEAAPQRLSPQGPSQWLNATRLLMGPSCAWQGVTGSPREPAAAGSTTVATAVAGEALRLTVTAADMIVSRAQAPAVAQAPVATPRSAPPRLEPRRVALSLPPSGHVAFVMPTSAGAATAAPVASRTPVAFFRAVSICDREQPFVEVRPTVPPAARTWVPATATPPPPGIPELPVPAAAYPPPPPTTAPLAEAAPPPHSISSAEVQPPPSSVPAEPAAALPLAALTIEPRHRDNPPPLPARRLSRAADRAGADAAFALGRRPPSPTPSTAPALLSPASRCIEPLVSSSLQPLLIPLASPSGLEPLPAAEPVSRVDVTPTPKLAPASPPTDAGSVREALNAAQKTKPSRRAMLSRAAMILWHDVVVPFLATRRGKFATVSALTVFSLFLGLRGPNGPLRGVTLSALQPLAERSYFLSEDGFAAGLDAWTDATLLNRLDNGLVEIREGLTLYRPSLRRADYEFSFAATIRKSALGWVVRASDPSNYYACKIAWRGKGKEKRSVLVRYPVVNGSPAAPEKVVALPFEIAENKVYNLVVTVHGDRITTLIDGRGVDSFSDARLLTGGIGFLAGPGEEALVHSVAVTGNDDPTGRTLAWMLGFGRFMRGKAFGS